MCTNPGICDTETKCYKKIVIKNEFEYSFSEEKIKLYNNHSEIFNNSHRCDEICSRCRGFCELEYGHFGYHSLKMHKRVKEEACDAEFFNIMQENVFDKEINDYTIQGVVESNWHRFNWETPVESLFRLGNTEIENEGYEILGNSEISIN